MRVEPLRSSDNGHELEAKSFSTTWVSPTHRQGTAHISTHIDLLIVNSSTPSRVYTGIVQIGVYMASQVAKCGVRVILLLFIFCFIFLCHTVVTQNSHEGDNEVPFKNDKITSVPPSSLAAATKLSKEDSNFGKSQSKRKVESALVEPAAATDVTMNEEKSNGDKEEKESNSTRLRH